METLIAELAKKCRVLLETGDGVEGREKIASLLTDVLSDPGNVEALVPETTRSRDLLYEDPELGFCILAHNYTGPKSSSPHDHGPSWAIYAQARGETEMTDYELVVPATEDVPGKVRAIRTYRLRPGDARVYEVGALHSPTRSGPTSLIRVEGTDLSKVKRLRFEVVGPGSA